ncbi:hypothetical protein Pla22_08900 [Rubripirellula amarantea]|uniref:Uncharacterized protein n=1 Tax=Rubripirellula amarantea TaxID=2527999 RepID=A0A5C5WTT5_9BACT|nr:hypothetical protein Pla22_08900 [Rubripirellula amarantea]
MGQPVASAANIWRKPKRQDNQPLKKRGRDGNLAATPTRTSQKQKLREYADYSIRLISESVNALTGADVSL